MIQVVEYKINNNNLLVGFKVDNFVVYSQVAYDENKTKNELLQLAYQKCKKAIDYEKTLSQHSFVIEEEGEEFIPENPKPAKLVIDFNNLTGKVLDQYGDIYSEEVEFSIEGTDKIVLSDNGITIVDEIEGEIEYYIVAKYRDLQERQKRILTPPEPDRVNELREEILPQLDKINELENQVLIVQEYIVNKEYEELLKEGGINSDL